jgi:hypothetical protein
LNILAEHDLFGKPVSTFPDHALEEAAMTITLNHAIVPARDKIAAAKFFATIFGLKRGRSATSRRCGSTRR